MAVSKKENGQLPPPSIQRFPIVGIGASAGGLDAFKRLLKAIPENSGMAYVLVQHLSPSHESILPEILSRITTIPVYEITDDINLAPDNIYVIPSNKILTTEDGKLKLTPRDEEKLNHSVDIFFTSLAEVHQSFAVGVVLSGTGSDGSAGLKAIKEYGGITFAQEGNTAAYDGMPQSAMDTGMVDFILSPEEIPAQLLQIGNTYTTTYLQSEDELTKETENAFMQIVSLLRQHTGVDLSYYKQPTIRRRIARRMLILRKETLTDYLKLLKSDKEERSVLFQDMLIPVTSFFRDPDFFKAITDSVFPALFKNKTSTDPIRIWVAGCSTGEEAVSIAICLHEFLGNKFQTRRIQIFATDISEKAITSARRGIYSKAAVATLSKERLRNYFTKVDDRYQVNKTIRESCVFAVHNFLKDPPFARLDMISCRNVLIYMDVFLQKKTFSIFHYAIKENGFLLLGKSETPGLDSELFTSFTRHEKIYSRKLASSHFMPVASERKEETLVQKNRPESGSSMLQGDFRKNAEAILLANYTPASVIINEQMDIVHVHGSLTSFLEPSPGKPTFNLMKMARQGLGFELRNAVHKAKESKAPVIKDNLPVKDNGAPYLVSIEIVPLKNMVEPHFLVLFRKGSLLVPLELTVGDEDTSTAQLKLKDARQQIQQLEKELMQTRQDMRGITEEQEAINDELQSANEELLSSSEELQSLNEELETSKEELESSNEELIVVNQELIDKQELLNEARLYAESIIATIPLPLIILDKALRVKSASESFYKKFRLTEAEAEDKLFYELQHNQWDDNVLRNALQNIIPGKTEVMDMEIRLNFPSIGDRTMLINAKQINHAFEMTLILLSIEDITERKLEEEKIEASEKQFRLLADNIPLMIWTATPNGKRSYSNKYLLDYTGLAFDKLKNDGWHKYVSPIDLVKTVKEWQNSIKERNESIIEQRIRRRDGNYLWHKSHAVPIKDKKGNVTQWVGIIIEREKVTEKVRDDK